MQVLIEWLEIIIISMYNVRTIDLLMQHDPSFLKGKVCELCLIMRMMNML